MEMIRKNINSEVFLLFLIIYPFLNLPWNIYFLSLTKLIYLATFTVVLWAVFSLHRIKAKQLLFVPKTGAERLSLVFLILIGLSTLLAQDKMVSFIGDFPKFQGFIAWFSYITLFLFAYHFIPTKKQVLIIRLMVFASFFCGVYGIIQHFFINELVGEKIEMGFVRSWAVFDHANHFGSYLVIMITLAMTLYLLAKKRRQTITHWVIICTLFVSLLYTTKSGAWIAIFIGVLLLTIFVVKKRKELWKRWIFLLISIFILLMLVNISENNIYFQRFITIGTDINTVVSDQNSNEEAGSGRWGIWKRTFPIIIENYLIGTGPSSFSSVFPLNEGEKDYGLDNSHNEYIEIAMTMGIPALLVYLTLILTILKSSIISVKKIGGDKEIYLYGLIAAIIGYLIKVFFNISVVSVAPFFWVLLGMCYAFSMKVKTSSD